MRPQVTWPGGGQGVEAGLDTACATWAQLSQAGPGGWWPGQHWSLCHCTATTNLYFYFPWSQDNLAAGSWPGQAVSSEL